MNDTSNKNSKFRNSPMGKYIYNSDPDSQILNPDSYTLALLNSDNSEQFSKSTGLEVIKKRKSRKVFSIPRGFVLPNRDELSVYWHRIEVDGWKPETRQQASLSYFNDKLFLIGGIS